jgi:putative ABC transport system substrate-binding protein
MRNPEPSGQRITIQYNNSRMKIVLLLIVFVLAGLYPADAQQSKIPRVGIVFAGGPRDVAARITAFRAGLKELGYAEGKNINILDRYAEGKLERIPG